MVFSGLRQTQVLSAFSIGMSAITSAGTWYGLHALNSKINNMESRAEDKNRELVHKMRGELERSFRNLRTEIHNSFQSVHAKLDRLNRKLNQIHGVSILKKLLTNVADATTKEMFVNSISRGDIIECEENLMHFAHEFLEEETEKNWNEGLLQVGYIMKAYELEFAWLVAKGTEKFEGLLPVRLEEGARRLGNLIGRFLVAILGTHRKFPGDVAEVLLSTVASLSNDYARLFAPENQNLRINEEECFDGGVCNNSFTAKTHPRRTSAELFLAIGDISMSQSDREAAESSYLIALAFDPFYDASWIRFKGRLCAFEHLKASGHGSTELIETCKDIVDDNGVSSALLLIQRHAVDLEMLNHQLALPSTDIDRHETHLQGLLLLVEISEILDARGNHIEDESTDSLESLLSPAAGLLSSSMELTQSNAFASLLLIDSLLELVPAACSSSVVAATGTIDLFEAAAEAAKHLTGKSALNLLLTMTNECPGMDVGSLSGGTYSLLVSSLIDVIKTHHTDEEGLVFALELLAGMAHEHEKFESFGPKSVASIKKAFQAYDTKPESTRRDFATHACRVVSSFTREGRVWAIHELEESFSQYCKSGSLEPLAECCGGFDQDVALRAPSNDMRINYGPNTQRPSKNCIEMMGRKRYAGDMLFKLGTGDWEPSGKGTMEWNGGSIYQGHWESNIMNGNGTLRIGNVDIIDGTTCEGGYYERGATYRGGFKDGFFHGFGLLWFQNGTAFAGTFEEGVCASNDYPTHYLSSLICDAGKIVDAGEASGSSRFEQARSLIFGAWAG
uniref:Uncharacterized protein n=1 Tax=Pseudictyota dubia TaxID=2749911 RepID=A0A7R9VG09_9STRA|mmetsp:Transcript_12520/g.23521  ORF Transcript_12520/g.23521 Transcript_12520/m.23521 type:complete len:791 (+) Transcript_12520:92-2464(+)